jgi:hypothetical protein
LFVWDRVLLCSPGWPWTCDLPCLSLLRAEACTTLPSLIYFWDACDPPASNDQVIVLLSFSINWLL